MRKWTATERRQEILDYLLIHRKANRRTFMDMFGVSSVTIAHDITVLSCAYPIDSFAGNGGGIFLEEGYYVGKHYLSEEQESVLQKVAATLTDEHDIKVINDILLKFKHRGIKKF